MRSTVIASIVMLLAAFAQPAPPATGTLTGVVLTDSATPVPVRRATVRLSGTGGTARLVGTDDQGKFVFEGLPAGSFTLSAAKPGYVTTFHGSTRPGTGPGVLVAVQPGRVTEVTLRILPGAAISGLVTDGVGRPAAAVAVAAIALRSGRAPAAPARATTDDRGVYRIYGLPPGEYVVSALPRLTLPAMRGATPEIVATTDEDVRWARRASEIGIAGATAASATSPAARPRAVTYAPVYYPTTTDAGGAARVPLAVGEERTGIDIALRIVALSRLAGSIVDSAGQPVTIGTVALYPRRREESSVADLLVSSGAITLPRATMTPGAFSFAGVAPGEYTMVARTGTPRRGAPPSQEPTLWSVTDITVDNGLDQTDLALHLLPGARLSGSIVFERSMTAPPADRNGFEVTLAASGTPLGTVSTPRALVDPSGTFRFSSVPPGLYVLQIAPPPAVATKWTMKSALVRGRDLLDGRFEMKPGTDVDGVTVTFTDRPAGIAGRLVDATGGAVARYSVVVFPTERSLWIPDTRRIRVTPPASDGSFTVMGLPPGEYALAAIEDIDAADAADPALLARLLSSAYRFTLAEGERKSRDLQVGKRN
jgi:hypothetical protein